MIELKPCPFCGGRVHMIYSSQDQMYHVYHEDLFRCAIKGYINISGDCAKSLADAKREWNRRAGE